MYGTTTSNFFFYHLTRDKTVYTLTTLVNDIPYIQKEGRLNVVQK